MSVVWTLKAEQVAGLRTKSVANVSKDEQSEALQLKNDEIGLNKYVDCHVHAPRWEVE